MGFDPLTRRVGWVRQNVDVFIPHDSPDIRHVSHYSEHPKHTKHQILRIPQ